MERGGGEVESARRIRHKLASKERGAMFRDVPLSFVLSRENAGVGGAELN